MLCECGNEVMGLRKPSTIEKENNMPNVGGLVGSTTHCSYHLLGDKLWPMCSTCNKHKVANKLRCWKSRTCKYCGDMGKKVTIEEDGWTTVVRKFKISTQPA